MKSNDMGKIISVVGNLGAGKTTLTKLMCDRGSFSPCWEDPEKRPFSADFAKDRHRWALANQMDFFLFRCQQELTARQAHQTTLMDGGFDQDFHVFTRHIYHKGYLVPDEYKVCEGFYHFARGLLPPPEVIVRVVVDPSTLLNRRLSRGRQTIDQSFAAQELADLEILLGEWLKDQHFSPVIAFPFTQDFHDCLDEIDELIAQVNRLLLAA